MSVYLGSNKVSGASAISVTQKTSSGTNIADITIGNTTTELYAPSGETMYDAYYDADLSSVDSRGVSNMSYTVYPVNASDCTLENALKIKAYHLGTSKTEGNYYVYPLIITFVGVYGIAATPYMLIMTKSIYSNVQSTSSTYLTTGKIHIVAPFEIASVSPSH